MSLSLVARIMNYFSSSADAETTATTSMWWALAMIAHPDLQKRGQDELDERLSGGAPRCHWAFRTAR